MLICLPLDNRAGAYDPEPLSEYEAEATATLLPSHVTVAVTPFLPDVADAVVAELSLSPVPWQIFVDITSPGASPFGVGVSSSVTCGSLAEGAGVGGGESGVDDDV